MRTPQVSYSLKHCNPVSFLLLKKKAPNDFNDPAWMMKLLLAEALEKDSLDESSRLDTRPSPAPSAQGPPQKRVRRKSGRRGPASSSNANPQASSSNANPQV